MARSQMQEAKDAERSLPSRGSVRLCVCSVPHRGYSGYSQFPLPRVPQKSKSSNGPDATPKVEPNARTPEAGPAVPEVVPRPPASLCSHAVRLEYRAVPLGYCSGTRGYRCRRRRTMGMELSAVSEVVLTVVLWYPWVVG